MEYMRDFKTLIEKCRTCKSAATLNEILEEKKIFDIQVDPLIVVSTEGEDVFYSLKVRYLRCLVSDFYIIKPTTNYKEFLNLLSFIMHRISCSYKYIKYTNLEDNRAEYVFDTIPESITIDDKQYRGIAGDNAAVLHITKEGFDHLYKLNVYFDLFIKTEQKEKTVFDSVKRYKVKLEAICKK